MYFCSTRVNPQVTITLFLSANFNRIFSTKNIIGLGKFQDRGLKNNNPIKVGLEKIKTLLSNDPSAKASTLKVSLSTSKAPDHDHKMYGSSPW